MLVCSVTSDWYDACAGARQPARPALRRFQRAVSSIQQEQQVIRKFPSNRDRLASVFERGSLTMGTGIGLYSQADKAESRQAPGEHSYPQQRHPRHPHPGQVESGI